MVPPLDYDIEVVREWFQAHGLTVQWGDSDDTPNWDAYTHCDRRELAAGFRTERTSGDGILEPFWFRIDRGQGDRDLYRCPSFDEFKAQLIAVLLANG